MYVTLLVIGLVVGYVAGKLDAIWRLQRGLNRLTSDQRDTIKPLFRQMQ